MSIFSEEQVLKVLDAYNPWWKTGKISGEYIKQTKRVAYYEVKNIVTNNDIRRFALLSGTRRVGKTTILYQLIEDILSKGINEKNILYLSLDNPILKFGTLDKIIEIYINALAPEGEIYLFLDEIQYAKDWNNWLKVFYDLNKNWKIVATGSASPLIEKEVTESGVGRWTTINVPTLSFYEYCRLVDIKYIDSNAVGLQEVAKAVLKLPQEEQIKWFKQNGNLKEKEKNKIIDSIAKIIIESQSSVSQIEEKIPKNFSITNLENYTTEELGKIINLLEPIKKYFNRYLTIGGFPELVLSDNDRNAKKILREDIVDKVLKRDMPELFSIRNISTLEKVFLYLCFESSNIINFSSMGQDLEDVSVPTLQDYVKYLESANLIYISEPLNDAGTKLLKNKPKIYIADSAIRNAVLMKEDILLDNTEMGYVVETAVYRHMYTYMKNITGNIGYYREKRTGQEIDIITNSVKENMYIEVKYKEKPTIKKDNPIYKKAEKKDRIFMITKKSEDYSVTKLENGKKLVKIPAYAFLFLVGLEEMKNIEK